MHARRDLTRRHGAGTPPCRSRSAETLSPKVIALEGGGYVVAWSQAQPDGSSQDYFRILDNNGLATSAQILAAATSAGATGPSATAYANGQFEVDGTVYDPSGTPTGGHDGSSASQQILAAHGGFISETDPSVSESAGGGYAQVSLVQAPDPQGAPSSGTSQTIDLRWFDASGAQVRDYILPVTIENGGFGVDSKESPSVAGLTNGETVVAWDAHYPPQGGIAERFEIFDANGDPLGVHTIQSYASYNSVLHAKVAALPDGGFVITWAQLETVGANPLAPDNEYFQTFDAQGQATSQAVLLGQSSSATPPGVALLPDGEFAVTFAQNVQGGVEIDSHVVGANHPVDTSPPGQPQIVVMDTVGPKQGPVPAGGATDDTNPEIRVQLSGAGAVAGDRVYWVFAAPSNIPIGANPDFTSLANETARSVSLTASDIARGYADIPAPQPLSNGDTVPVTTWLVDSWNNVSAGATTQFSVDTQAPGAPSIAQVSEAEGGAAGAGVAAGGTSDDLALIVRLSIAGRGAAAGDQASLSDNGAAIGAATLSANDVSNGYVGITTSDLGAGAHSLAAQLTDQAGIVSAASAAVSINVQPGPDAGGETPAPSCRPEPAGRRSPAAPAATS